MWLIYSNKKKRLEAVASQMLVAMFKVLLPICLLALARGQVSSSADQEKSASDKAFDMTQGLYITIRNIAFPEAKISDDKKVGSRFLLIMPGKVLNYGDYFPGKDYINFVNVSCILIGGIMHYILCSLESKCCAKRSNSSSSCDGKVV